MRDTAIGSDLQVPCDAAMFKRLRHIREAEVHLPFDQPI